MKLRTFHTGGIHVPENKLAPARIIPVVLPMKVQIPLKQHIGLPAVPIVKKGDHVTRGQKIAEARGMVSAPVHASISGTVAAIGPHQMLSGYPEDVITIAASPADHQADIEAIGKSPEMYDTSNLSASEIAGTVADAGVVGLGGATFPSAVKLSPPPGSKVDTLIINAVECEPYLTCDNALMLAHPAEIIEGIDLMMRASGCHRAIIGIEDNKPLAIEAMQRAAQDRDNISVQALRTKYPQGGEKQLIYALVGKEVPGGALPVSAGVIVHNVGTAYAVYRAVALRQPLIERVLTIGRTGNFLVPIGMLCTELLAGTVHPYAQSNGIPAPEFDSPLDVVAGGPMMGRSVATLDAPVVKGTSGIIFLEPLDYNPQPCIRCGACVEACPMGLEPYLLSKYGRLGKIEYAADSGAMDCIECGSCSYSCPSARPILDYIKVAKGGIRRLTPKK